MSQNILILSSNTGGGHQSAALALEESFNRLSPGKVLVNITQVLEEAHFVTRRFADVYNYLLRYHQYAMRYYYGAIERLKPYESNVLFQLSARYGRQILDRISPSVLVSVHPMTQHFFAHLLRQLRLTDKIPLVTVVTDPCHGFWKGWACDEVSRYFVASDEAKAQLTEYGIAEDRIVVSGMPVHARFKPLDSDYQKIQLRQALGLDPERFTVLVNAGWIGGGNVPELYHALVGANIPNLQLVFITGKNAELKAQAERLVAHAPMPTKVLGFTRDMELWMSAADVMISKLGGLTTFEAMACHLPILGDCLTPPMPQEAGTARYIEAHGAGRLITHPAQVLEELNRLTQNPQAYRALKTSAAQIGRPGAVDLISENILSLTSLN